MLTVLPDASVLYGHATRPSGDPKWRRLCELSRQGRLRLAVSDVTLVELEARLRERALSLQAASDRAEGGLRALGAPSLDSAFRSVSPAELAAARVRGLRDDVLAARGTVLPAPGLDVLELSRRAAERRRPFDAKGNGFRDALLWETTVEVACRGVDVLLVSADTQAFAKGEALHPELLEEVRLQTRREDSVTLALDLATAAETAVERGARSVERLRRRLASDDDLQWDVFKTMVVAVQDHTLGPPELRDGDWPQIVAGTRLRAVVEPAGVAVVTATPRTRDECLATLETRTLVVVDVRADDLDDELVSLFSPERLGDVGQPLTSPYLQLVGELELDLRWAVDIDVSNGLVGEARIVRVAVPGPPPAVGQGTLELKA